MSRSAVAGQRLPMAPGASSDAMKMMKLMPLPIPSR
jgi:hypothetical protein